MNGANEFKIGVSTFAWTNVFGRSHIPLVARVREYGFSALEIPMFVPGDLPASAIRNACESNRLACTICAILPPGINPISPDSATRKRSIQHLAACIDTAAESGARLIGGPLFAPIGYLPQHRPTEDEWMWALEAFHSVTHLLETHAMTLSIEPVNRSETFFIRTAAEASRLCEAIGSPFIGVTIDTFHANIEERSIPAALEFLGPRLAHLHASENDRGILGTGHVPFGEILETLKRICYTGYVVIEGFGFDPDSPGAPGWLWADPNVRPEAIAQQGLAYLDALR